MALHQHTVLHQLQHGFTHGDAGHVNLGSEVAFGRQSIAGIDVPSMDRILNPALELQIERSPAGQRHRTIGKETVRQICHLSPHPLAHCATLHNTDPAQLCLVQTERRNNTNKIPFSNRQCGIAGKLLGRPEAIGLSAAIALAMALPAGTLCGQVVFFWHYHVNWRLT